MFPCQQSQSERRSPANKVSQNNVLLSTKSVRTTFSCQQSQSERRSPVNKVSQNDVPLSKNAVGTTFPCRQSGTFLRSTTIIKRANTKERCAPAVLGIQLTTLWKNTPSLHRPSGGDLRDSRGRRARRWRGRRRARTRTACPRCGQRPPDRCSPADVLASVYAAEGNTSAL